MTETFAGARWWKFDFHTHTPFSTDTPWHKLIGTADELKPEQWLRKWMDAGIDCVAITDHNGAGWIDVLKTAYAAMEQLGEAGFRPLVLFPGVELSVGDGGVHILAVFDPGVGAQQVDDLVSKCKFSGARGSPEPRTTKSLTEVLETITRCGAVAIAAHADQDKGLVRHQDGPTKQRALESEHLLGLEVVDPTSPKPQMLKDGSRLAEVVGSDCHNFRGDRDPGRAFTWVKMGEPSIEGLRLALLDASTLSVRRSDAVQRDPNETPATYIDRVTICEARYAGRGAGKEMVVSFSPWLSTLIGGRGTGKSTVLQMVRLALGLEEDLPKDLKEEFDRFRSVEAGRDSAGALTERTQVEIEFVRCGARHRVRWRGVQGCLLEEQQAGEWKEVTRDSRAVAASLPLQLLSQKQVFAIASEPAGLLRLIDKTLEVDASVWSQKNRELEAQYLRVRADQRETEARLADRPRLERELADVARQIKLFEEGDQKALLRNYQRTRQQRSIVDQLTQDMTDAARQLEDLLASLQLADVRADLFDGADKVEAELLQSVEAARTEYQKRVAVVQNAIASLEAWASEWTRGLESSAWSARERDAATRYGELVDRLKQEGVADPGAYRSLVVRRQGLEQQLQVLATLEAKAKGLAAEALRLLDELGSHRRSLTDKRVQFLGAALANNEHVRIELVPYGDDAEGIEGRFRQALGAQDGKLERDILQDGAGVLADLYRDLPTDPTTRGEEFAERLAKLKERVFGVASGQDDKTWTKWMHNHIRSLTPEQLDRFRSWWPEDSLAVSFRQAKGKFQALETGSPGQKSAAILAFLLSHGTEPILLDQPEDDLDNELIYDLIVQRIRASKEKRQVIIATHNANIVVNGDAENVLVMANAGGQCWVKEAGCLQERSIRDAICRVMEGGEKAFVERYRRIVQEVKRV